MFKIVSISAMSLCEYPSMQKRLNITLLVSGSSPTIRISSALGTFATSSFCGSGIFSWVGSSGTVSICFDLLIWSITIFTVTLAHQDFSDPVGLYFPTVSKILIIASCIRSRASSLSPTYLMQSAKRKAAYFVYNSCLAFSSPRTHSLASSLSSM